MSATTDTVHADTVHADTAPAVATGPLAACVRDQRVLVCCGAGGVGKTTTSAALALAAARAGRRVLVLTIDPSKRLAETLGVNAHAAEPVRLAPEVEAACGIEAPGALSAWMLDPKQVCDSVVRKLVREPGEAEKLLQNRIYGHVTRMIAGMQEYTAVEALYRFLDSGHYDMVVLDTPPARNALSFLEAPSRLSRFLEGRIFSLFLPAETGFMRGAAQKLIGKVLGTVFGDGPFEELRVFFSAFQGIFQVVNQNAQALAKRLREPDVTFLLVTSPARAAVEDALFFMGKLEDLSIQLGGLVLNRTIAALPTPAELDPGRIPEPSTEAHRSAFEKLRALAARERLRFASEREVFDTLAQRAAERGAIFAAAPDLQEGADDLDGLVALSGRLARGA